MLSTNFCEWMFQTLTSLGSVSFMYTLWFPSGALRLCCSTSDVPLKQRNRTAEMAINNRKLGWNCDSKGKSANTIVKTPRATWLSRQCAKRQVWKFRLRTYVIKNRPSSLEVTTRNREEVWKQNKSTQFSTLTCHKFDESSAVEIPAYQCSASGTNAKYTEIAVPSGR